MKRTDVWLIRIIIASLLLVLIGWLLPRPSTTRDIVRIDGSSTVFPLTEVITAEFQQSDQGGARIIATISGTGGGFKKFCRGETDIQNASRPIRPEEMDACAANAVQYYELPVALDAVTVVVSLANTWVETMTLTELKRIWEPAAQGTITRWNQVRASWPDAPLRLFGAGPDSGTFDYFTQMIVGNAKASRSDYASSEDDTTLAWGVARDGHALGYIPYTYFDAHKTRLRPVLLDEGKGPIAPDPETIERDLYPLTRPVFIYVSQKSAARRAVRQVVEYYLLQAPMVAREVNFVPLPPQAYAKAEERFRGGILGTAYNNAFARLTIDD